MLNFKRIKTINKKFLRIKKNKKENMIIIVIGITMMMNLTHKMKMIIKNKYKNQNHKFSRSKII